MLRSIDKPIKLNNAVVDSYFDAKFKEYETNVEIQISETMAHYVQALNEKDRAIPNQVNSLQDYNSLLEAKISSAVDSISSLDKKLDSQDIYERRDTLVFSGSALLCLKSLKKKHNNADEACENDSSDDKHRLSAPNDRKMDGIGNYVSHNSYSIHFATVCSAQLMFITRTSVFAGFVGVVVGPKCVRTAAMFTF